MDSVRNLLDKYRLQQGAYGLFVGTLEPRKNVETILEAFARIQSQLDPTFKIVLVGKRAWGWESIRATLRRLKLTRKVVVTGYVPAKVLPLLYSGAKVFLYPSYYEGFGLPVLEAMACGIPVITSNTSSLPEIVGNSGIMLEPKNSEELAKQMLRLIQDEEYHSEWARKGLARAQWFSWETAASKTLAAYREMEELL